MSSKPIELLEDPTIVNMCLIKLLLAEDRRQEGGLPEVLGLAYARQELLDLAQGSKFGIRHDIPQEILRRRHRGT